MNWTNMKIFIKEKKEKTCKKNKWIFKNLKKK